MSQGKRIIMLGTSAQAWGGIATVVNVYRQDGLFERCPVTYLTTHSTGHPMHKLRLFVCSWLAFMLMLVQGKALLVHSHTASGASFWRKACFLLPAFLFRVPAVIHLHAGPFPDFYYQRCGRWSRALVRAILDRAARVVVVSSQLKRFVEDTSRNRCVVFSSVRIVPLIEIIYRQLDAGTSNHAATNCI